VTVDFLLIGAAKSATTSLSNALSQHPDICFSDPKEPQFFLVKIIGEKTLTLTILYLKISLQNFMEKALLTTLNFHITIKLFIKIFSITILI